MTALPIDAPAVDHHKPTTWATRIPAAFRLQFIVPTNLIIVPAMVFVLVWAVSIAITMWIAATVDTGLGADDPMYGGASQAAVWTLGFMAAYTVTQTLPFAQALSYSRRTFVLGAYLAFLAVSVGFGAAYALAAWIERLTNGFGIYAYQFDTPVMTGSHGILGGGVLAAAVTLAVMTVAFLFTAVFRRVSLVEFWVILVALAGIVAVAGLLLVRDVGWSGIGSWFLQQTAMTGTAYMVGVAAVAAVLGYLLLRRDTPRG